MKRSQDSQPSLSLSSPALKKPRVTPPSTEDDLEQVTTGIETQEIEEKNGVWTKVERRAAKKYKKVENKLDANLPRFLYAKGEITKRREAVGIEDVRDLVLHIAADAPPPSWVRVENPQSIPKVVVLLIPGLTPDILSLPPLPTSATTNPNIPLQIPLPNVGEKERSSPALTFISSTFSHACPTRAPGEQTRMHSVLGSFFQTPVSGDTKKKRIQERIALERTREKDPFRYVLTTEQMIENGYPMPSYMADIFEKTDGWVEVPKGPDEEPDSKEKMRIWSIDCEMCQTEEGKVLARVCVVDYVSGIAVYDKLVKPESPITDYLTRWSGITPEALSHATTTFTEVQSHILRLLSSHPTPILLGHSLESDLKTLKICHPRCIDTALIYHHPRGRPMKPGLAWLTKKWCGREIQNRGEGGHDPEEDARACIDLLKKKVDNGPGFGEFKTDQESIFERMSRARGGTVRSAVIDRGNPAGWHGAKATTTVACKTDEEILTGLLDVIPNHSFTFGRFTAVADALGWIVNRSTDAHGEVSQERPSASQDISEILSTLDSQLKTLYTALPKRTALVIFTGHSDPIRMADLNARKNAFEIALKFAKTNEELPKWSTADARELEEEVVKAKRGLLFLGVKTG